MEFDFKQNYSKDSPEYEALEYVASKLSEMTDCEFTVGSTDIFKTTLLCDGIQVCANDLVNACNSLDLDNFCDEFIVHHGKEFAKLEAIISSMTLKERKNPDIIKASRKQRIANGSGTSVQEVNKLLNQFEQMKKMMKMMKNGSFKMPF